MRKIRYRRGFCEKHTIQDNRVTNSHNWQIKRDDTNPRGKEVKSLAES